LGQKKKFRDQDESMIMKTYAMFYVSENDEFDNKKKMELLNIIEKADEQTMEDLFESGEIETPPMDLFEDEMVNTLKSEIKTTLEEAGLIDKISDMLDRLNTKLDESDDVTKKAIEEQIMSLIELGPSDYFPSSVYRRGADALDPGVAGMPRKGIAHTIGKAAEDVGKYAQEHPGVVGAAATAAAVLAAGVLAYRRIWSKAAKACKNAPDKDACMRQYKVKAKQAQAATLNAAKAKCAKTKNPDKCKAKIDAKIKSLKG
jgi:hypothetical protein